jgi:hypothetical protein
MVFLSNGNLFSTVYLKFTKVLFNLASNSLHS